MTGPDIYVLYGIPTLFLVVGVFMYAIVRLDSHRYAAKNAAKSERARAGTP